MSLAVLVVDDHPSVRAGLRALIDCDDRLWLSGTAENGRQALDLVRQRCPDVIVCDVEMPVMDGLAAVPLLRRECPEALIAMYSSDLASARAALQLGADRVFDKTTDVVAMLEDLIRVAHEQQP